jgi:hypothetical protein
MRLGFAAFLEWINNWRDYQILSLWPESTQGKGLGFREINVWIAFSYNRFISLGWIEFEKNKKKKFGKNEFNLEKKSKFGFSMDPIWVQSKKSKSCFQNHVMCFFFFYFIFLVWYNGNSFISIISQSKITDLHILIIIIKIKLYQNSFQPLL